MKIMIEATVYEKDIAQGYKNDVLDGECFYPFEDYVREALYEDLLYDSEIVIPDEEVKKVAEKVKKELDKLLEIDIKDLLNKRKERTKNENR